LRHPLILAHEFLDALPIHAFELVPPLLHGSQPAWRELLVTNISSESDPQFTPVPAKTETLASRSLPMSDLRYKRNQFTPGTRIEISSTSIQLVHAITSLLVTGARASPAPVSSVQSNPAASGSALIIDYGPLDGIPSHSLRGISKQTFTSPFDMPGLQDLTADVDFGCVKDTALSVPGARVSGPISQGDWLVNMGLTLRADRLIATGGLTEERKEDVRMAVKRLAGKRDGEMGRVYNVLAITYRDRASEGFAGISFPK
jgi:NADH dehydrogenase [ubiquinone] 1 alpha subcomplex assembly factor 7